MSAESQTSVALTHPKTAALVQTFAGSLAARGLSELRPREDATYWLMKGIGYKEKSAFEQAFACFDRGIRIDPANIQLQLELGWAHLYGDGPAQDLTTAAIWFQKAAEQGNTEAQFEIYLLFFHGAVGIIRDVPLAASWLEKVVSQDPERYLSGWDAAYQRGGWDAAYEMGCVYEKGDGVDVDNASAFRWYCKAADRGCDEAMYRVGVAYWKGRGVQPDTVQAFAWWSKAGEQNHPAANYMIAVHHFTGFLVPQNFEEGVGCLRKAADAGDARAQSWLGECYQYGQGVVRDVEKAVFWYRKSAEQGERYAQEALSGLRESSDPAEPENNS
jgi:TPR repeat protein